MARAPTLPLEVFYYVARRILCGSIRTPQELQHAQRTAFAGMLALKQPSFLHGHAVEVPAAWTGATLGPAAVDVARFAVAQVADQFHLRSSHGALDGLEPGATALPTGAWTRVMWNMRQQEIGDLGMRVVEAPFEIEAPTPPLPPDWLAPIDLMALAFPGGAAAIAGTRALLLAAIATDAFPRLMGSRFPQMLTGEPLAAVEALLERFLKDPTRAVDAREPVFRVPLQAVLLGEAPGFPTKVAAGELLKLGYLTHLAGELASDAGHRYEGALALSARGVELHLLAAAPGLDLEARVKEPFRIRERLEEFLEPIAHGAEPLEMWNILRKEAPPP